MLSDYTSVLRVGQCIVLFYIHFHYQICFNDFQYENRVLMVCKRFLL